MGTSQKQSPFYARRSIKVLKKFKNSFEFNNLIEKIPSRFRIGVFSLDKPTNFKSLMKQRTSKSLA